MTTATLSRDFGHPEDDLREEFAEVAPIIRGTIHLKPATQLASDRTPAPSTRDDGHAEPGAHVIRAVALAPSSEEGHASVDTQFVSADLAPICNRLRELHRQRQDLHRAEKSLTLQIKAKCRRLCGGDKKEADVLYGAMFGKKDHDLAAMALAVSAPFLAARDLIEGERKSVEKQMDREAKKLPVLEWVNGIRGFGVASLAALVGEAGDLGNYANPAKLWKRMGLAVINGGRQRRVSGAEAIEHGYCASRRSVMWNIGGCVLKSQSESIDKETGEVLRPAGEYRAIYDARKAYETERVQTKAHAHNRATRYMEKRMLRDLWRAWRDA